MSNPRKTDLERAVEAYAALTDQDKATFALIAKLGRLEPQKLRAERKRKPKLQEAENFSAA